MTNSALQAAISHMTLFIILLTILAVTESVVIYFLIRAYQRRVCERDIAENLYKTGVPAIRIKIGMALLQDAEEIRKKPDYDETEMVMAAGVAARLEGWGVHLLEESKEVIATSLPH